MGDLDIRGGRFDKYPDTHNQTKPRTKVAGIEGKMVRSNECSENVACGPGQAVYRMGKVAGAADTKPSVGFGPTSSGSVELSDVDNMTSSRPMPEHRMKTRLPKRQR